MIFLAKAAFLRLRRHLDALPGHVEFPAVIGAAQPAFFVAAEPQRGAAMRRRTRRSARAALAVAERDETLGQQLHPHRRSSRFRAVLRPAGPGSNSCGTAGPSALPGPVWVTDRSVLPEHGDSPRELWAQTGRRNDAERTGICATGRRRRLGSRRAAGWIRGSGPSRWKGQQRPALPRMLSEIKFDDGNFQRHADFF